MTARAWERRIVLLALAVTLSAAGVYGAQASPPPAAALLAIPEPSPTVIRPRMLAGYGTLVGAALLSALYIYRGRAFIVYWMVGGVLTASSLFLTARGYADARLGAVMLGLAQLLGVWASGLLLLGAAAYPDAPLRWNVPLRAAAATAVWFLASPLAVPLEAVLISGRVAIGVVLAWAAVRYLRLFHRTHSAGAGVIAAGLVAVSVLSIANDPAAAAADRLFAFIVGAALFVGLGVHLMAFEDMVHELRQTNRALAQAHDEVRRLAITDPLTGCHNRRFFDEIERRELQRHRRYGSPLSVVFIDVNRFKHVNDTLGHETGDGILRAIGALLRRQVRESDYVIRWGGDEFLLLLNCTELQAERKASDLKRAFRSDPETSILPGGVGLSVGVAPVRADATSLNEAIQQADERMYADKEASRT